MAPRAAKAQKLKSSKGLDPIHLFMRTMHQFKNARVGIAKARTVISPTHFPEVVKHLSRIAVYGSLLAPMTFPGSIAGLTSRVRLEEVSDEGELLWTASVLALYAEQLAGFIAFRDSYYDAYNYGDFDQAEKNLDAIQVNYGYSIWLIGNRLQLLQTTKGLQAQKTFLEEILSTEGISQFVAWIAYFLSVRAEDNVSYSSFEDELKDVLNVEWIRDYVRLHLLPTELGSIVRPGMPIAVEEPHPLIDRFETFVAMAQSYCATHNRDQCSTVVTALNQLAGVRDVSIRRMLAVLRDGYSPEQQCFISSADAYTEGRYADILSERGRCDYIELVARAYGFLGCQPPHGDTQSLVDQLITHVHNASAFSIDAPLSRQKLRKLALLCPDRSLSLEISAFLQRSQDIGAFVEPSVLDIVAAISRPLDNPWSAAAFDKISSTGDWLTQLSHSYPDSPAIKLKLALTTGSADSLKCDAISIPAYRRSMYLGHVYFRTGQFEEAASHFLTAATSTVEFESHAAKRSLFNTYYASARLFDAVQLAIDHILETSSAATAYPLEALAREYLSHDVAKSSLDLAVLLHLAIRYCAAKLERDLSNIYENFMGAVGIDRPSSFRHQFEKHDQRRLVYFLRYVCIPRILDDTTFFDSVEEIDQERISVCQLLMTHDPENIPSFQAEIRAITRASEVASLLSKMQTTKIYVDEAGVREQLESSLTEPLARYLNLLESPELAYQAEKLSKRISEMLSSKGRHEFKDLKLPATEREGLFNAMLSEAVEEFALNPAFGLDTHVSTSIRHGAFEGHLRRALAVEDLLCLKRDKEYLMPPAWRVRLPSLNSSEFDVVQKSLGRFSQRFEELLHEYLKLKLHIRLVGDDIAMFNFNSSSKETQALMDGITPNTTLTDLTDRLVAHCWVLTTRSLDAIREDLVGHAAKQMALAFDALVRSVESKIDHTKVVSFIDAIARSRTSFQIAIEDVAGWFQRPTDLSRDPFDIEVAIHVALQQIANCYVRNPLNPIFDLGIAEKIDGRMLDGLCEILFILFQNVIRHGGFGEERADIHISVHRQGESLQLQCRSKLADDVSISERRQSAVDAMKLYERDSALRMARKEGGSGLSKVWRIAEFDLRVNHKIELSVSDQREFVVQLSLAGVWA